MIFKRFVVISSTLALLVSQTAALAQTSHQQGVNSGTAANAAIRGLVNKPTATAVVPGYTNAPPETAYAGRPTLGADANAMLAACAGRTAEPTCQALRNAIASANTPRPAIGPGDPAVAAASRITRNPAGVLANLADYYTGCTTSLAPSLPRTETRTCSRFVGVGSYACSKRLTVAVNRTFSCTAGEWFAHASSGTFGLDAQCIPGRPDSRQHFRVTDEGNPLAFFDVDMTAHPLLPQKVKDFAGPVGSVRSVYVADRSCNDATCTLQVLIAEGERTICVGPVDAPTCTTQAPFFPSFGACPAGTQSGDNLIATVCAGNPEVGNCTSGPLDASACYSPDQTGTHAVDSTGTYQDIFWSPTSARPVLGWVPNPAFGPIDSLALVYAKPKADTTLVDAWNDACPNLAAGGRCAMTSAPVCVDGPSSRLIDGVSVARPCWEFQSSIACSDTVTSDTCAALAANGCNALASACVQTNAATGACEIYRDQYSCPVPGEVVATVSNCPANVFCIGANCFNTSSVNDPDFGRSVAALEASREAGAYLDTNNMRMFIGVPSNCSRRFAPHGDEVADCCKADGSFGGYSNQSLFGGSPYAYDTLFTMDNAEFLYQAMAAMVSGGEVSGSFSAFGVTVSVGPEAVAAAQQAYASGETAGALYVAEGGEFAVGFDPWSIVIMIIILLIIEEISCDAPEEIHNLREGAGLCHQVGSHCVRRHPFPYHNVCRKRNWSHCCFNSMLSRIVNEQGRVQLAKSWGTPQAPDCSGFTIAQLQALDFGSMDFSEFYASIVPKLPNAGAVQNAAAARAANCYYGKGKCR